MSMFLSSIQNQQQTNKDGYIQQNFKQKFQKLSRQNSLQIYNDKISNNKKNEPIHQSVNFQDVQNALFIIKQQKNTLFESQIQPIHAPIENIQNIRRIKQQRAFSQILNQQNEILNRQSYEQQNEKNKLQINNYIQKHSRNNSDNKNKQQENKTDYKQPLSSRNDSHNKENINCYNFQQNTQKYDFNLQKKLDLQKRNEFDTQKRNDFDIQKRNDFDIQRKQDSDIQRKQDSDIQTKQDFDIQKKQTKTKPQLKIQPQQQKLKVQSKFISHPGLRKKITKVNQDSYVNKNNLYGVYDGHGHKGELVSQFISNNMNLLYENFKEKHDTANSLFQSYKFIQKSLESTAISNFSGSTALTIKLDIDEQKIYVCNVGDSRVVIKLKDKVVALSQDHKPCLQKEADRIKGLNGQIDYQYDQKGRPSGPLRVWTQEREAGLAMTRSLGDQMVKKFGVCWQPEICVYNLNGNEQFLIIASDGVWEFLSNLQCANLVQPFFDVNDLEGACQKLYEESKDYWLQNSNDSVIDDITVGIVFFKYI